MEINGLLTSICLIGGHFANCLKGKCIHGSMVKLAVGMFEAWHWNTRGTYQYIDTIICCSEFLKPKMNTNLRDIPDVNFIFAGTRPLEDKLSGISNIKNVGFQSGQALENLIREARSPNCLDWVKQENFLRAEMYWT